MNQCGNSICTQRGSSESKYRLPQHTRIRYINRGAKSMRGKAKGTLNRIGSAKGTSVEMSRGKWIPTRPTPCVNRYWFLLDFPFGWLARAVAPVFSERGARWAKREINDVCEHYTVRGKIKVPIEITDKLKWKKPLAFGGWYCWSLGRKHLNTGGVLAWHYHNKHCGLKKGFSIRMSTYTSIKGLIFYTFWCFNKVFIFVVLSTTKHLNIALDLLFHTSLWSSIRTGSH